MDFRSKTDSTTIRLTDVSSNNIPRYDFLIQQGTSEIKIVFSNADKARIGYLLTIFGGFRLNIDLARLELDPDEQTDVMTVIVDRDDIKITVALSKSEAKDLGQMIQSV